MVFRNRLQFCNNFSVRKYTVLTMQAQTRTNTISQLKTRIHEWRRKEEFFFHWHWFPRGTFCKVVRTWPRVSGDPQGPLPHLSEREAGLKRQKTQPRQVGETCSGWLRLRVCDMWAFGRTQQANTQWERSSWRFSALFCFLPHKRKHRLAPN